MAESPEQIVARVFDRARADCVAAPLADAFAEAYDEGAWTVDELDRRAAEVAEHLSQRDDAPRAQEQAG